MHNINGSSRIKTIINRMITCDSVCFFGLVIFVTFPIGWLFIESTRRPEAVQYNNFMAVAHWFDPVFFQYNLIMVLLAILILPFLVFSYTHNMIDRKERRLLQEIKKKNEAEEKYKEQEAYVKERLRTRASFSAYGASLLLAMTVVSLGACIILLFKPTPLAGGVGVHFNLGANMLMMGPFIELFDKNIDEYYIHLTRSLTAFQFGFLGAYIYFIGSLARAYFTLDLTHQTFVDGSIRMIVASVLALILSFASGTYESANSGTTDPTQSTASLTSETLADKAASSVTYASSAASIQAQIKPALQDANVQKDKHSGKITVTGLGAKNSKNVSANKDAENPPKTGIAKENVGTLKKYWESMSLLPVLSFLFGFYPKRALSFLDRIASKQGIASDSYRELPLSSLAGISYAHESRLEREGFDNIENLSHADALDLAIRTGFSYKQLAQWIDEAWLVAHLRDDYEEFVKRTGITSGEELRLFFSECKRKNITAVEQLKLVGISTNSKHSVPWEAKLTALEVLLILSF